MKSVAFHRVNLARHAIMPPEAHEALLDDWPKRRRNGDFYEVLGRTGEGRYLQLVVEDRREEVYVFHGRDMTDIERRRYRRK